MAVLGLIPIPIVLLNVLNELAAQLLANGAPVAAALGTPQRDALAAAFIALHGQGLAQAVMVAGVGYLLGSFTSLLAPQFLGTVNGVSGPLELGEPPIIPRLLIWGARAQPSKPRLPSVAT